MAALDTRKLGLILARLASEHEGEVVNAARFAVRMLASAGMRPEQLTPGGSSSSSSDDVLTRRVMQGLRMENQRLVADLAAVKAQLRQAQRSWREEKPARPQRSARDDFADETEAGRPPWEEQPGKTLGPLGAEATAMLGSGMYLTAWDRNFLGSLLHYRAPLSMRQQAVWERLRNRYARQRADMAGAA